MRIDRNNVEHAFGQYVSQYNPEAPKIKLKINHTYRVAALCETIAVDISAGNPDLAWLTGMLHDIGRFEQVRRYGTFSDAISVDHAQFGADLLFREGLLDFFVPENQEHMTDPEKRILEKSIRFHSCFRLPEDLNAVEQTYCHILRDADKIDIMRVNYETPMEEIYNVSTEALKHAGVSEEVKECFRNRTAVFRPLKKTAIDHLVGHLCLMFELKYPVSKKIAREQGYVDKLLGFQSENKETRDWFIYMNQADLFSADDSHTGL